MYHGMDQQLLPWRLESKAVEGSMTEQKLELTEVQIFLKSQSDFPTAKFGSELGFE